MISEDGKKLYTTTDADGNLVGISLWEIMKVLGYYKRDTNGNRNLGMIIKNANINKWAKFKPIRVNQTSPIDIEDRHSRWYGLSQSGYYFVYNRPRGTEDGYSEPYRILDFNGYNHAAECPMLNSSRLSKEVGVGLGPNANFSYQPNNILNTSENVEIPLEVLTIFPNSMYVGVMFINRRTGTGFYHTYAYTLQDIINESHLQSEEIVISDAPDALDGDILDFYYCLGNEPNQRYQTNTSAVIPMCCDELHGHAVVKIISLGYEKLTTYVPTMFYEYSGTNAVFNQMNVDLLVNFPLDEYPLAALPITFRAYVNNNLFGTRSFTISYGSIGDDKKYTIQINGNVDVSRGELEDNLNEVQVSLDAKFNNDSEWRQFGYGSYNVERGGWTEWHYVNQQ